VSSTGGTRLDRVGEDEARDLLASCLAAPGWVDGMLAGRPYVDRDAVLDRARDLAARLSDEDVQSALARHPRIAEPAGTGHDVAFSTAEQAGVDPRDRAGVSALRAGNAAYEERFGRVFLIRAAGRSGVEILEELRRRLGNSPEAEGREVAEQLGQIALLRLARVVAEDEGGPDMGRPS
jgi:OHCU decarboxylase